MKLLVVVYLLGFFLTSRLWATKLLRDEGDGPADLEDRLIYAVQGIAAGLGWPATLPILFLWTYGKQHGKGVVEFLVGLIIPKQ